MNLRPKAALTEADVKRGLRMVIGDGLANEAVTSLTGGAFLVAFALLLGASNFQIGLLASLPTFTNIFQLLSIWLVRKYNNRRAIAVTCLVLARVPLLVIASLPLFFSTASIDILIIFLFFFYFFSSIAGPAWNSWMKDLVPEKSLGRYFSRRSSYMQMLNVVLSFGLAMLLDFIKERFPQYELTTYSLMFMTGGLLGISGALILSKAPEPQSFLARENLLKLFRKPLRNTNFRKFLLFNSAWVFALNIATPFFTVFMLKSMGLAFAYVIGLTIVSQVCSILTVRLWGRYSDRYSNKTIIAIGAPLYIFCLIAWCFVGIYSRFYANLTLLVFIHIFMGTATAGINLSLTNISLKLAPREDAIVYLSVRNIVMAFFSSVAPLLGGILADYFTDRSLTINAEWIGPQVDKVIHLLSFHEWNFLFAFGAFLALIAVEFLIQVKEVGEVEKDVVVRIMRSNIRSNLKDAFLIGQLINWNDQFWRMLRGKRTEGELGGTDEQGTRNVER